VNRKQQLAMAGTRKGSHGAMAFRRGAAVDHVVSRTGNKWERQADEAARRILHGERNVARMLTPTPAAYVTVPLSPGDPLPAVLRTELEQGFGADLSAVRIHRDQHAAAAARSEHAHAFASGPDIYFSEGAFDATRPLGRRLIVHEVAHVLQQTGRASSEGRLRATSHLSTGPVQCDTKLPPFADLRKLHQEGKAGTTGKYAAVADELERLLKATDRKSQVEQYARKNIAGIASWPAPAESLLYDTLKSVEAWDAAAELLERDDFAGGSRILTAAQSSWVYDALQRRYGGGGVFSLALEHHTILKAYADEFLRLIEVFVFQPINEPVPLLYRAGTKETIAKHEERHIKALADNKVLKQNEWFTQALSILRYLDDWRVKKCTELQKAASLEPGRPEVFRKRPYVSGMRDWAADVGKLEMQSAEATASWRPQLQRISKLIQGTANKINKLWDRAQVFNAAKAAALKTQGGKMAPDIASLVTVFNAAKSMAEKTKLPERLAAMLDKVNAPDSHGRRPPAPEEYAERVRKLADELDQFSYKAIEDPQAALFHQDKLDEEVAALWLSIWLSQISSALRYGGGTTDQGQLRVADVNYLVAHRIWMARWVRNLAAPFAWSKALQSAQAILEAELEKSSQLALLPGENGQVWVKEDVSIEEMLNDFGGVVETSEPLTFYALALFFRTEYYRQMSQQLKSLLPVSAEAERKRIEQATEKDLFLTVRAQDAVVGQSLQPVRGTAQRVEFAEKASSLAYQELLKDKTKDSPLFAEQRRQGRYPYYPVDFRPPVVVWFLPPFGRIAGTLRKSTLLQALVDAVLGPAAGKKTLSDEEWIGTLLKINFYQLSKTSQEAVIAEIEGRLEKERQAQLDVLTPELRRATTIDRQVVARHAADRIEHRKRAGGGLQPLHALQLIRAFVASIQPKTEDGIQLAALMLELAPVLDDAFAKENWFAVVNGYLGLLEVALDSAPSLANLATDRRALFLPKEENSGEWINQRKSVLSSLVDHFRSVRKTVQKEGGFRAIEEPDNVLVENEHGHTIPSGTQLIPTSRSTTRFHPYSVPAEQRYTFIRVLRSFEFESAYGTSPGAKQPTSAKTGSAAARLLDPKTGQPLENPGAGPLLEVLRGKKTLFVGADQMDVLQEIAEGAVYYGVEKEYEHSLAIFGAALFFYLEGAELVPGFGQVITASRLAAAIEEFFRSGAWEDAKSLLGGDLMKFLKEIVAKLGNAFDPENLVQTILFPDPRLERILSAAEHVGAPAARPKPTRLGTGRFAWIGKVLRAFRKLGTGLARAAGALHKYVQKPAQDFRFFASTRPAVAFALRFAADNIYTLAKLGEDAYLMLVSSPAERKKVGEKVVRDIVIEQQQGLADHVHGVLQMIEQVQLPAKVIHTEPIVQKLINEVLAFIVGRLGLKGKLAVKVLDAPGVRFLRDLITGRIAEAIVGAGADLNRLWTGEVVPEIEGYFNSARNAVVDEINNKVLRSNPFQGLFASVPKRAPLSLKVEGEPFEETQVDLDKEESGAYEEPEEAQPHPSADRPLRLMPASVPSVGAGQRLDPRLRGSMESSFQQDFRHVRLHAGADGEAMTHQFGADAVTTGSHVFLRSGVSPHSTRGESILRHELTHVVHQTGPRPPGGAAEPAPVAGRPGRGLTWDPASEREAERAAAGSSVGAGVGTAQADGLQPTGISLSTLGDLLKSFSDLPALEAQRDVLNTKLKRRTKETKLRSAGATAAVENVLTAMQLEPPTVVNFANVFSNMRDVRQPIENRFRNAEYAKTVRLAAFDIASEFLEDLPVADVAGAPPAGTAKTPEKVLTPRHFARKLEGFILTELGIGVSLKLNTETIKAPNGHNVEVIASTNTVKEISITYVHLPYIDGRNDLWGNAIKNTWPTADEDYRVKARSALKPLLMAKGVKIGVWAFGSVYKLNPVIEYEVDELIKKSKTGALDPSHLPPWEEYVKTKKLSDPLGVRIATYGHASQTGTGRESHHLTQFLLADYFANTVKTTPAFKKTRKYPGVKKNKAGEVELISKSASAAASASATPAADSAVLVAKTKGKDRGEDMPAISLAAPAHRGPDLHITPEPDDIMGEIRKTQSHALNNQFQKALASDLRFDANDSDFNAYVGGKADDDIAKEIYKAVQETYQWVEHHMNKQFTAVWPGKEFAYFAELDRGRAEHRLKDETEESKFKSSLEDIPKEAYDHNKTEMEKLGWKTS